MDESQTIHLAAQGDQAAWAALMRDHQGAVFRLAYLLLRDADEAEDVAQEAFIRAFRALGGFDTERPLRPWLLQIAANLARNRQRSVRRYLAAAQRWFKADPGGVTAPPEADRLGRQWEAQQLWRAIGHLRSNEREILYLRYFLELSETEIAGILQIAPGTVKSRLHRATGRLRAIVDAEFPSLREERHA